MGELAYTADLKSAGETEGVRDPPAAPTQRRPPCGVRRCALSGLGGLEGNGRPWPAKTHPVNGFFLPRAGPATAPVAGGVPPAAPRGRKVRLAPALFLHWQKKRHPPAPLLPLIREKARSARLLGCKRPPNGSLSLPPFPGRGQGGVVLYRGRGDSKGTAGLGPAFPKKRRRRRRATLCHCCVMDGKGLAPGFRGIGEREPFFAKGKAAFCLERRPPAWK